MPPASQTNSSGLSFTTILTRAKARLAAKAGLHASKIRVACMPDKDIPEYITEPGYIIRFFPPDPKPMSGAGRYAYVARRRIEVWVVTRRLVDPGGRDDFAAEQHVEAEEKAIDALCLDPQTGDAASLPLAKFIKWVPGGRNAERRVSGNKSLIASSIAFDVTHVQPVTVYRE